MKPSGSPLVTFWKPSSSHLVGLYWVLQVVAKLPVAIGGVTFLLINIHTILLQAQGRYFLEESYMI